MAYELDREQALEAGEVLINVLSVDDEYYFAKGSVLLSKAFDISNIEWNDALLIELGSIWSKNTYELYPLTQEVIDNETIVIPAISITRAVSYRLYNEKGEVMVDEYNKPITETIDETKTIEKEVVAFYNPLYECQMYNGKLYVRTSERLKHLVTSNPLLTSKLFELCPDLTRSNTIQSEINQRERSKVTSELRESILKRDNYTCQICGASGDNIKLEVDHIIPISKGGKSILENLQCLCQDCNRKKGSKIL